MGSPQCVSANVGNPLADVDVDGVAGPRLSRRDTELRAPVSEPVADGAETEGVREYPDSVGHTLSETLEALLRVSHAADCSGTAAGRLRLLREVVVVLVLLVLRELATLGLVMRELATLAAPSPSWS